MKGTETSPELPLVLDPNTKHRNFILAVIFIVILISWVGYLDKLALDYIDSATNQSLAAFGIAKIINAFVSMIQTAQFELSLGVGASLQVGQLLDPINDAVEQYSEIMKLAIASLFGQKMLIEISSTTIFKLILTFTGLSFAASLFTGQKLITNFLFKIFASMVFLRIIIVLVVLMNGIVSQAFIDNYAEKENIALGGVKNIVDTGAESEKVNKENALSIEENNKLKKNLATLVIKRESIIANLANIEPEIIENQKIFDEKLSALNTYKENLSTIDKISFFDRDEKYKELDRLRKVADQKLEESLARLEDYTDMLDDVDSDIMDIEEELSEDPDGWLSSTKQKLRSLANMSNISKLGEKLDHTITSMINLMTIFLIKTIIMPLIILLIFLKSFKGVWGIDAKDWVNDQKNNIKNLRG
ncbi:coiled-coil domain-containing protein [Cobetia marina]|uniref:hypothetical protein n=1 Tax=Cobetia marina TaxID=28258 RepID=UPI000864FE4B|nr:hypothetical protein [Cobetia marina]AOM01179.1 hypothetical protein BFX80_07505 [Cobetia marina]